jgi:hypothetical protein
VTLYCCLGRALALNGTIGAEISFQIIFRIPSKKSDKFATVPDVASSSGKEEDGEEVLESEVDASKFSRRFSSTEDADYIFDPNRFDAGKKWCVYNVMLVEWIYGVAYRLGIGRVHLDAFFEAKPAVETCGSGMNWAKRSCAELFYQMYYELSRHEKETLLQKICYRVQKIARHHERNP